MKKHTPGPWYFDDYKIKTDRGDIALHIADLSPDIVDGDWQDALVNGTLMAAAPDMADALIFVMKAAEAIERKEDSAKFAEEFRRRAVLALKKAGVY